MLFALAKLELATEVALHGMPEHEATENNRLVRHVTNPPGAYPGKHVTATVSPVVPTILFAAALSELATDVDAQAAASHVNTGSNVPAG
jgi:hypothetical protein